MHPLSWKEAHTQEHRAAAAGTLGVWMHPDVRTGLLRLLFWVLSRLAGFHRDRTSHTFLVPCCGKERFSKVSSTGLEFTFSPSTDHTDALKEYRAATPQIPQLHPLHSIFRMIIYVVQRRLPSFKCCVYFIARSPDSSSPCTAVLPVPLVKL